MATIANLLIRLGVTTTDADKQLAAAPAKADRAGQETGRRFAAGFAATARSIGRTVASITATAAVGLGGMAAAGVAAGIKTAGAMEQAQIGFTTLLRDGNKARGFLEDLAQFSASTPFEFPGVRDAARQLLGVGQSAKSVIPTLTAFGDAAGALGLSQEQFERIMLATTQALGKGKFQAEELLQITEAGLPVWPLLSKAMGKPVAELQKMASQGKLVAKDVLPLLQSQMAKDYGGAMAKQAETLNGKWSTFKDTVSMGLGKAMTPLMPLFNRVLTAATALTDQGLAKLTGFIETTAAPWLDQFATKVQGMFGAGGGAGLAATAAQIRDAIAGLFTDFDAGAAQGQMATMGDSLAKLGPVISDLISQLPSLNDLINVSATVVGFLADHADLLAKSLPYLVAGLVLYKVAQLASNVAATAAIPLRLAEVVMNRRLAVANTQLAASITAQTAATRAATVATVAETAASNGGVLAKMRNTAATVASRAASIAANVATKAWAAGQWLLNAAMSANPLGLIILLIVAVIAVIVALWMKNEGFRKVVIAVWNAIKAAMGAVLKWITGTLWPMIKKAWDNIANGVKIVWNIYTTVWGKIIGFVKGLAGKISSAAKGMWNGVVSALKSAINKLIGLWNQLDLGISVSIPSWVPVIGGKGFSISDVFPDLPMLARGALVPATPGGVLAVVGEGRHDEVVAPLPPLMEMIKGAVSAVVGPAGAGGENHYHFASAAPTIAQIEALDARRAVWHRVGRPGS